MCPNHAPNREPNKGKWLHLGASDPLPKLRQSIKKPRPGLGSGDGAKRIRTADPLHAMQVLYQLSYGPMYESLHLRPAATPQLVGLALLPDLQAG